MTCTPSHRTWISRCNSGPPTSTSRVGVDAPAGLPEALGFAKCGLSLSRARALSQSVSHVLAVGLSEDDKGLVPVGNPRKFQHLLVLKQKHHSE